MRCLSASPTPRSPTAWGSETAIAELLGHEPSGGREAELWFGAHHASPSRWYGRGRDLRGVAGPRRREPLPFLFKVLAAQSPLSLQAHPDAATARRRASTARTRWGSAWTTATRNYRDPFAEARADRGGLEDGFQALCGFRPVAETRTDLELLLELGGGEPVGRMARPPDGTTRTSGPVFEWLIAAGRAWTS